jgi:hypothetical protein
MTKLYDRTGDEITLDEVERITIWRVNLRLGILTTACCHDGVSDPKRTLELSWERR